VRRENRGPQIFLSRAHPEFMKKLFTQEVPEIYDGIIEIKAAARDPGSRAKIGVISHDGSIDPVGACVGMKGSRVQAVVQEMQGEKIDIIPWSPDTATFVVNALQPANVSRVVIDEEEDRIEVVVPDDQLSLAIGRRGQNVRLASQLTAKAIDILTETDASEKRQAEFVQNSEMFQNELDVDETQRREATAREERRALGVEDALAEMPHLSEAMLVTLGKAGIRTLDDLADLATDELIAKKRQSDRRRGRSEQAEDKGGILAEYGLNDEQGNEIIMAARAHWFEDEEG
ncbi:MAG: transcription termination/antitermination protein NusA, partial [Sphingobium sp. 32-64-5]